MALIRLLSSLFLLSLIVIVSAHSDFGLPGQYNDKYPPRDNGPLDVDHVGVLGNGHGSLFGYGYGHGPYHSRENNLLNVDLNTLNGLGHGDHQYLYDQNPVNLDRVDVLPGDNLIPNKPGQYVHVPQLQGNDKNAINQYVSTAQPSYEKPKPDQGSTENVVPTKPYNELPQKTDDQVVLHQGLIPNTINIIGIQGVILCKSAYGSYDPLVGAVARITCPSYSYENGYLQNKAPFTILSPQTDANGFFLTTLSVSELKDKLYLKGCKVFLQHSPSETCTVPTDINGGVIGANLSLMRILQDKTYYTLPAPLIYTSKPHDSLTYIAPVSNDHLAVAPTSPGY